jgi:hypothetical protein
MSQTPPGADLEHCLQCDGYFTVTCWYCAQAFSEWPEWDRCTCENGACRRQITKAGYRWHNGYWGETMICADCCVCNPDPWCSTCRDEEDTLGCIAALFNSLSMASSSSSSTKKLAPETREDPPIITPWLEYLCEPPPKPPSPVVPAMPYESRFWWTQPVRVWL